MLSELAQVPSAPDEYHNKSPNEGTEARRAKQSGTTDAHFRPE